MIQLGLILMFKWVLFVSGDDSHTCQNLHAVEPVLDKLHMTPKMLLTFGSHQSFPFLVYNTPKNVRVLPHLHINLLLVLNDSWDALTFTGIQVRSLSLFSCSPPTSIFTFPSNVNFPRDFITMHYSEVGLSQSFLGELFHFIWNTSIVTETEKRVPLHGRTLTHPEGRIPGFHCLIQ